MHPAYSISSCFSSSSALDDAQVMELRRLFVIPEYLRTAMAASVRRRQLAKPEEVARPSQDDDQQPPPYPLIVIINNKSGGHKGLALSAFLSEILSHEQVFDIDSVQDIFQYGLGYLDEVAQSDEWCAKTVRINLRILVGGGDGTVARVLSELNKGVEEHVPPVGIIPLGTGNDLARSFGWGVSFKCPREDGMMYLLKVAKSIVCELDSWTVGVKMHKGLQVNFPRVFHHLPNYSFNESANSKSLESDMMPSFEGRFFICLSIGMYAQVAYAFDQLRRERPNMVRGPILGKIGYGTLTCKEGWFCTKSSIGSPQRFLHNVAQVFVKKTLTSTWELLELPSNMQTIMILNIRSYGGGQDPWGHPQDENGFVEPRSDDGLLEIVGATDGWHALLLLLKLRSAIRFAQGVAVRIKMMKEAFMEMDGEPWWQLVDGYQQPTIIEINQAPKRSLMLKAP